MPILQGGGGVERVVTGIAAVLAVGDPVRLEVVMQIGRAISCVSAQVGLSVHASSELTSVSDLRWTISSRFPSI